jgi:hypothetical protein
VASSIVTICLISRSGYGPVSDCRNVTAAEIPAAAVYDRITGVADRGQVAGGGAGRTVKLDLRLAPDEKVAWAEAARVRGMSTSEWIRAVLNLAAREVLREPVG